jgi:hypothetical protein
MAAGTGDCFVCKCALRYVHYLDHLNGDIAMAGNGWDEILFSLNIDKILAHLNFLSILVCRYMYSLESS